MADYGVQTWDANGNPNNYGIKPVTILGQITLTEGQKSGSYGFPTPPLGTKLGYFVSYESNSFYSSRRTITISGATLNIGSASDGSLGANIFPASASVVSVFVEKV